MFLGLRGLSDLLTSSLNPTVKIHHCADGSIKMTFDGMHAYESDDVEIDVDLVSNVLSVHAETPDHLWSCSRSVQMPCEVQNPETIVASKHEIEGSIVVTIPFDSQVLKAPAAAATTTAVPKKLKVNIVPLPSGQLEAEHSGGVLTLTMRGMEPSSVGVDLQSKVLKLSGKTADTGVNINRRFKLHRRVTDPAAITAQIQDGSTLVVSVPDSVLESESLGKERTTIAVKPEAPSEAAKVSMETA